MAKRPIYYREAYAITYALRKNRFYLDSSPFTTIVRTDQASLRWMKTSRRGPVAGWLAEELSELDFTIKYIPGPKNVIADALSRFPMVTPTQPSLDGIQAMFGALLGALPDGAKDIQHVWVWADKDTIQMSRQVQRWRKPGNAILKTSPTDESLEQDWELAVVAPSAEIAPLVCEKLFGDTQKRPFACLVPSDLVCWIGRDSPEIARQVERARKISLLAPGFTWLIHGFEPAECLVYLQQTGKAELDVGDLVEDWLKEQAQQREALEKECGGDFVRRPNGLLMYARRRTCPRGGTPRKTAGGGAARARDTDPRRLEEDLAGSPENLLLERDVDLCQKGRTGVHQLRVGQGEEKPSSWTVLECGSFRPARSLGRRLLRSRFIRRWIPLDFGAGRFVFKNGTVLSHENQNC